MNRRTFVGGCVAAVLGLFLPKRGTASETPKPITPTPKQELCKLTCVVMINDDTMTPIVMRPVRMKQLVEGNLFYYDDRPDEIWEVLCPPCQYGPNGETEITVTDRMRDDNWMVGARIYGRRDGFKQHWDKLYWAVYE